MVTIDEIKKMRGQGMSEQDIRGSLRARGMSDAEVSSMMTQAEIKNAVSQSFNRDAGEEQNLRVPERQSAQVEDVQEQNPEEYNSTQDYSYAGMQPSMMQQEENAEPQAEEQTYPNAGWQAYGTGYPSYQPYQEAMSSDIITEISEQVVSERLSVLREKMEEAINFKSTAETRISSLNERLERIEGILDRLQLSVLQKVGEYVNDVKDIKFELQETQRSFKKLAPELKRHHGKRKKVP